MSRDAFTEGRASWPFSDRNGSVRKNRCLSGDGWCRVEHGESLILYSSMGIDLYSPEALVDVFSA